MLPRASVVMLTYNRPQFIGKAIESIQAQQFREWELLVVHDGPNQEIPAIMEEWVKRDPRIRYFHRETPGNIADATNFGLTHARAEYIAILDDDDDWASDDKLSKQVTFLDEHRDYCCCGGGVIVIDATGREQMRYLKPEQDEQIKRQALMANPLAHSTTLYRRASAIQVGGYDVSLAGFQDWDLWLKLGKIGKLYNFPEYFLHYRVWHGSGSFHQSKGNTESAVRITRRHRRDYSGFAIAFPMVLLYHAYAHLPRPVHRFSYSFLSRCKKAFFAHRPEPKL
ncbi:MAG TPA: glycosyltransferase [Bryobacteraceae bacterium]|nr:glycosyltransferase [Bryobacteraceae bacterium]